MPFIKAAAVSDIAPGKGKQVSVGGKNVAIFNVNGAFCAIDNDCPHRGAPLAEGDCEGNTVVCPWHGATFDLTTGAHLSPPAPRGVKAYPVQIVGDEVHVEI